MSSLLNGAEAVPRTPTVVGAVSKAMARANHNQLLDGAETETEEQRVAIQDKPESEEALSNEGDDVEESEPERESELCQFCLQPMDPSEEFLKVLPCGHKYHEVCLQSWDTMNPRPASLAWRCPNRCHVSSNTERPNEDMEPPVIPLPASDDDEDEVGLFA